MNLKEVVNSIEPVDRQVLEQAQEHTSRLVMPPRALGRLNEIGERICAIQRTLKPSVKSKAILVMAGDHGIVAQGVSAFPQEVTGEMVKTFVSGGAGINVLARQVDASVYVVDMGIIPDVIPHTGAAETNMAGPGVGKKLIIRKIARGTKDFTHGPAMTKEEALKRLTTRRICQGCSSGRCGASWHRRYGNRQHNTFKYCWSSHHRSICKGDDRSRYGG